jgi:hypothetical protein
LQFSELSTSGCYIHYLSALLLNSASDLFCISFNGLNLLQILFLITQYADLLILIIFISQFVGVVVILFGFFPLDIIVMECSSFLSFILVH